MNNSPEFRMVYKTFFHLFCFSLFAFLINFFLIKSKITVEVTAKFHYSIPLLYLIFVLLSLGVLSILLLISRKNIDYVGYSYLLITSIKMGVAYFLMKPILASSSDGAYFEKTNFFVVFIYFLAIETLLTVRILNNKQ